MFKKTNYSTISMLALSLTFFTYSCASSAPDTIDDTSSITASAKEDCESCTTVPSDVFADVIYFNIEHKGGDIEDDDEVDDAAEGYCDTEFFSVCDETTMVITGPGVESSRTELKLPSCYNQSLNDYSTMEFTTTLSNVPSDSDSPNKGVSIGQLHNRGTDVGRPLVRIDATTYNNKVRVTFGHTKVKGEADTDDDLVDFTDGDELFVQITISSTDNIVSVYVENITQDQEATLSYTVDDDSDWIDISDSFYYKSGVYQQIGNSTQARSEYSTFSVSSLEDQCTDDDE